MRSIAKVIFFILIILAIKQCEKNDPDPIVDIPDYYFLNALIVSGIDKNGDSQISFAEAEETTVLNVSKMMVEDMTGIEAFINLDTLSCGFSSLSNLDLSGNTALRWLSCGISTLSSLNVSNNPELTYLECGNCNLRELDLTNCTKLETLLCAYNMLNSLDLSNNNALQYLSCTWNQLTVLDLSQNTALEEFYCAVNFFDKLDLSNNTSLKTIQLTEMPSLYEVCVWETPFPPSGVQVDTSYSPNLYFTTECSAAY